MYTIILEYKNSNPEKLDILQLFHFQTTSRPKSCISYAMALNFFFISLRAKSRIQFQKKFTDELKF